MRSRFGFVNGLVVVCVLTAPRLASADTYYYVEWSAADVAAGTASGTITLPDKSTVTVNFAALSGDGGTGRR
jgi:uncharacterized protein affecting Mg2+/Co2+ transport